MNLFENFTNFYNRTNRANHTSNELRYLMVTGRVDITMAWNAYKEVNAE